MYLIYCSEVLILSFNMFSVTKYTRTVHRQALSCSNLIHKCRRYIYTLVPVYHAISSLYGLLNNCKWLLEIALVPGQYLDIAWLQGNILTCTVL